MRKLEIEALRQMGGSATYEELIVKFIICLSWRR
jgi:hypothetical protein